MGFKKNLEFKYGNFKYIHESPIIRGKFEIHDKFLNIDKNFWFPNDDFFFYDLEDIINQSEFELLFSMKNITKLYCLAPYLPYNLFKDKFSSNHKWPAQSSILLNSKTGKLIEMNINRRVTKIRQLMIISNFYASYIREKSTLPNIDFIIPVPAKPSYPFNSVEIACKEFSSVLKIPLNTEILKRTSHENKKYQLNDRSNSLCTNKNIAIFDDIIKDGETKETIASLLKEKNCSDVYVICLGRKDIKDYYGFDLNNNE